MTFNPFSALTSKLYGAIALVALLAFGVQTVRLEGLHVWPVSITGWIKTAEDRQAALDVVAAAEELAAARAAAARLERERIYSDIAERIDDNADAKLDGALDAAERFIAAGGVRGEANRSASRAARAATEDRGTGGSEGAGRSAELDDPGGAADDRAGTGLVLVPANDVRICTVNTIKAEAAHEFVLELEQASER